MIDKIKSEFKLTSRRIKTLHETLEREKDRAEHYHSLFLDSYCADIRVHNFSEYKKYRDSYLAFGALLDEMIFQLKVESFNKLFEYYNSKV